MRVGARIAGVMAVLVLALAAPLAAAAQSRQQLPHDAAVDAYVEELPTATGSIAAEPGSLSAQEPSAVSGSRSGGSGGLFGLGLVLAGTGVAIVLGRVRSRSDQDSS